MLRETLVAGHGSGRGNSDPDRDSQLRRHVQALVNDLQAAGWPPERVVTAVKEIAREGGLASASASTVGEEVFTVDDAFLARIARWTVDHYFDQLGRF